MNQREYGDWRRSLLPHDIMIANVCARYHANVTTEMLDQALAVTRQLQVNHNALEARVDVLETEIQDLQRRIAALEQSTTT